MKKRILLFIALFLLALPGFAQTPGYYARRIAPVAALPATCNPLNGDVVYLTAGAGSQGVYSCQALNTWKPISGISNQIQFAQGTLTADRAAISTTATWNNGAVSFTHWGAAITNTASAATSKLLSFFVGASNVFSVQVNGQVTIDNGAAFTIGTRGNLFSGADGIWTFTNTAATGFTRLNLGPSGVAYAGINTSTVGGNTQGIIITRADGTAQTFANLGAATNGSMIYCSDCTIANPCAGAGTGAIAKRLNGVWVCN